MSAPEDIRPSAAADVHENVRQRYAEAARASAAANHEQARAVEASEPHLAVETSAVAGRPWSRPMSRAWRSSAPSSTDPTRPWMLPTRRGRDRTPPGIIA